MTPTTNQVSGMADRTISGALIGLLGFFLHKLVVTGILAENDVTLLSPILIILLSAAWGYYVNRPTAIVQAAASLPGTVVVTTSDLSDATPNQSNIVSNITNNVVDKVTKKVFDTTPVMK